MQWTDLPKNADYFIPHRAPMVLVDELVDFSEKSCVGHLTVRPDLPFMQDEGLPSWVGIEIMAQTIAMYAGVQQRLKGEAPKLGFLLGCKKFEMAQAFFAVGEQLRIDIELQFLNQQHIGIFDCTVNTTQGCTTATLLVAQPEDANRVLANIAG